MSLGSGAPETTPGTLSQRHRATRSLRRAAANEQSGLLAGLMLTVWHFGTKGLQLNLS